MSLDKCWPLLIIIMLIELLTNNVSHLSRALSFLGCWLPVVSPLDLTATQRWGSFPCPDYLRGGLNAFPGILARWSLSGPREDPCRSFPVQTHSTLTRLPTLEASQSFVTALFEMHVFLIHNILIVSLIFCKLHEKYKGLDQEIVTKF